MKICTWCKKEKELKEFGKNRFLQSGYRYECKECRNSSLRTGRENLGRFKKGHVPWIKGKKLPADMIERMRIGRINPNAKSKGISTYRYRKWRDEVLKKCENKCMHCGIKENLDCHHIKPWKTYEKLRFDVDNGLALCKYCHTKEERKNKPPIGIDTRFKKGHKLSQESLEKMKSKLTGRNAWNKGKNLTEEHKKKLSDFKKRKHQERMLEIWL